MSGAKILFFSTGTRDCEKLWRSVPSGCSVTVVRYDQPGVDITRVVADAMPDLAVYIGTSADDFPYSGARVPTPGQLADASQIAPMIHLCSDAADPPWWPKLEAYRNAGSFRLQVAIDGAPDTPYVDMITLTPVHPGEFIQVTWDSRDIACGFAGGGGRRTEVVHRMRALGANVAWPNEDGEISYDAYRAFLPRCKIVLNDARTGSGERRHVKGRVVEAGLAGAVLMEPRDSPLKFWFSPGEEFVQWGSPEEAAEIVQRGVDRGVAERFSDAVLRRHSGPVFWRKIFNAVGVVG